MVGLDYLIVFMAGVAVGFLLTAIMIVNSLSLLDHGQIAVPSMPKCSQPLATITHYAFTLTVSPERVGVYPGLLLIG